jgi:phosphohistidine phosphatase
MKLFFLRHGLADRSEWNGPDHARPLTEKGKQRMAREARFIKQLNLNLDYIVSSPLTRALQTAQIIAEWLGMEDKLIEDERLSPGFGIYELQDLIQALPDVNAIMLVGHEPDFSTTVSDLIGGGEVACKKGSLARIDLYDLANLKGELVWLIPPKALAMDTA